MNRNIHRAIWYLFTTMLSIFSICTIRIFDGYNWPFYAVTANAVISLFGLIFHVHLDEREQKRPAMLAARINNIGVACSDFESEYYNPNLAFGAYNKAFELGDNSALINLAKAYATGLGTNVKSIMANNLLDAANYTGNRDNFFADNTWIKAKA